MEENCSWIVFSCRENKSMEFSLNCCWGSHTYPSVREIRLTKNRREQWGMTQELCGNTLCIQPSAEAKILRVVCDAFLSFNLYQNLFCLHKMVQIWPLTSLTATITAQNTFTFPLDTFFSLLNSSPSYLQSCYPTACRGSSNRNSLITFLCLKHFSVSASQLELNQSTCHAYRSPCVPLPPISSDTPLPFAQSASYFPPLCS